MLLPTLTTVSLVEGEFVPSGKGNYSRRGTYKIVFEPCYECYGMDVAPMNIFENQVIPVGIQNILKGFKPSLDTIRGFNDFKNKLNRKVHHF